MTTPAKQLKFVVLYLMFVGPLLGALWYENFVSPLVLVAGISRPPLVQVAATVLALTVAGAAMSANIRAFGFRHEKRTPAEQREDFVTIALSLGAAAAVGNVAALMSASWHYPALFTYLAILFGFLFDSSEDLGHITLTTSLVSNPCTPPNPHTKLPLFMQSHKPGLTAATERSVPAQTGSGSSPARWRSSCGGRCTRS